MKSQQLAEYVSEQMRVGHNESTVRKHLLAYGWHAAAIDDAFSKYRRANAAELKALRAHRRKARRRKWTMMRRAKVAAAVLVAIVLLVGVGDMLFRKYHRPPPPKAVVVTYGQKQVSDASTLAGTIAQYTIASGSLPTAVAAVGNNSVRLCGSNCASTPTAAVVLMVYKASGVRLLPYSPELTAPNKYAMYLVPHAKCASTSHIGAANTNPRSMVILFDQENGHTMQQRCMVL